MAQAPTTFYPNDFAIHFAIIALLTPFDTGFAFLAWLWDNLGIVMSRFSF